MNDIRVKFGISQEQFALYLGIPRSQIAAVESGARTTFVGTVVSKILVLMNLLKNKPSEPPPQLVAFKQEEAVKLNEALQARIKECEFQLMLATNKMTDMKKQYEAYCNGFLMADCLRSQPDEGKTDREKDLPRWIDIRSSVKLRKCDLQAQELLQLQMDAWGFEAAQALKKIVVQ